MQPTNYHTYNEIKTQTEAWAQALDVVRASDSPKAGDYDQVVFIGCGSTYYLSLAAAALYTELTGRSAHAIPGGELLLNPQLVVPQTSSLRSLLVAISRSGTTTETIKAVEKFKAEKRGDVLVISNYDEVLSRLADVNIVIDKGQEQSIAQTRSFASMYVVVTALCAKMAGREDLVSAMVELPRIGNWVIDNYEEWAKRIGENLSFDRFYFLGSGIRYGLACEVNLKMKEMTLTHSEPFHFLEFRHGPMSMVNQNTVVVGMLSEANRAHEAKVLEEMEALGGTVSAVGENEADVSFESHIPEEVRGVLYLPVFQLMAFYRSLAKGLNPDRPNNLTAVVKLNL
ncbi:MAG TPA: SIS domain-containing protein [Anaerolineales bacterium]|jgi:glucosamine--fructose-6-phosphate aminotransferase (isomerizing)|nr:SIS domain-containing protein [Anaerolineales bacterium]HNQ93429.1 SIS domain-containing protein [Anaerolineales bacterium]HNS59568.1 SIS domain-containing protein [Anaerolineales bacterium]